MNTALSGYWLSMGALMHHDDKGYDASKDSAVFKGLGGDKYMLEPVSFVRSYSGALTPALQ